MDCSKENMNIAVVGGGNIGTQFACICASKGYKVNMYSSKPELFDGALTVVDEFGHETTGVLNLVTSDIGEAVKYCRMIIVTHPAFMLKRAADQLLPYVNNETYIVVIPGTGGAEFAFRRCIQAGATLIGLQRVPTVARLEQYGKKVRCEGLRPELFVGSIPNNRAGEAAEFMSSLWGIPCTCLPNYLNVTLTPSNPILHTTRLCTLFADYKEGRVYDRNPLFYGDWSNESSELLIACDSELQAMLPLMNKLDLEGVRSLKLHYESADAEELTKKMRSIKSLHDLSSPMIKIKDGWIPDFNSRYFTADFPYGLAIILEFATLLGCDVPNISATMDWYRKVTGDETHFALADYGILNIDDIYAYYD